MRRCTALALATAALLMLAAGASAAEDPLRAEQWNLDAIHADEAHHTSIGGSALVAVIDSGVQASHPDLAGSVVEGPDFIDGDSTPDDQNGHGTNVAGIIVAHAGNGIGIEGVAPGARVLAIRALDASNRGNTDQEAAGIDAAVAAGAQVINLSLSAGPNVVTTLLAGSTLVQAIERAARAGVVVVAAAGNDGVPLCAQPLLETKILCVGSLTREGHRASYSNYAVRVDIVAPGGETRPDEGITSAQLGGGFSAMAGTSQATPHVAAAAALLVSLGLRGGAVIDRLEATATNLGNAAELGHGLLNAGAAVAGFAPAPDATSAAPAVASLTARVPKRARFGTVRRSGLSIVCTSPAAGRCSARVSRSGRVLARGSQQVAAAVPATIRARLTAAGRKALRRGGAIKARVAVSFPGLAGVNLRTTLVR